MRHYYEDFNHHDYDEICRDCQWFKSYLDWDEGGPEVAGGMAPQRVFVHVCRFRSLKATPCLIDDIDERAEMHKLEKFGA